MVTPEAYSEHSQTPKIKLFAKIVHGSKSLIIFARSSVLDGSEYACSVRKKEQFGSISF